MLENINQMGKCKNH